MSIPKTTLGQTSHIQNKPVTEKPKSAEIKPVEAKPAVEKPAVQLSAETKAGEKSNAPALGALTDTLGTKTDPKKGDGKTEDPKKAEDPNKAKDPKKPADKAQVQQQIEKLEKELKEAQARGDKDAIARINGELQKAQQQLQGLQGKGDTPAPVDPAGGATPAGGNTPAGGGAPTGGNAPTGGGAPAGGGAPTGGGAPAGGGAPTGGANEAGAGQGAGAGKEEVDQFIQTAAAAYGADPKVLSEIARRESNFNTGDVANNWDSNAKKGTPSKGMFQFIEPTFKSMMPQAKAANPGAWQGVSENWTDWKAQALTTAWAITHGKGNQWSTYQAAVNSAGGSGGTRTA